MCHMPQQSHFCTHSLKNPKQGLAALHTKPKGGSNSVAAYQWRISKTGCAHMVKYYSALKRKESLTHATTWMNPEDTMLSGDGEARNQRTILYDSTTKRCTEEANSLHMSAQWWPPGAGSSEEWVQDSKMRWVPSSGDGSCNACTAKGMYLMALKCMLLNG